MTTSKQFFKITPANANSANNFSYSKSGVPLVTFELPVMDGFLVPNSLRLNWKMTGSNITVGDYDAVFNDIYVGQAGSIQNITISSFASRNVLEQIRNYPRLLSGILPNQSDSSEFLSRQQFNYFATGNNKVGNQSNISQQFQDIQPVASNRTSPGAEISMPIVTGLLSSSNPIPLSATWGTQGLRIEFELSPDTNFYQVAQQAGIKPQYEISEVSLTGEYYLPSLEEVNMLNQQGEGAFSFNAYTSLYSVVDSGTSTHSFNLGLRNVIGAFMNFTNASFVNNYLQNGLQSTQLLNSSGVNTQLDRLIMDRSGVQFPNLFQLDFTRNSTQPYLMYQVWNMLKGYVRTFYNSVSFSTNAQSQQYGQPGQVMNSVNSADYKNTVNYQVAIPTAPIDRVGTSYAGRPLGFTLFANDLTDETQNSLYLFVLARHSIMYGNGQIQVIS